jgi:hypothetical protein
MKDLLQRPSSYFQSDDARALWFEHNTVAIEKTLFAGPPEDRPSTPSLSRHSTIYRRSISSAMLTAEKLSFRVNGQDCPHVAFRFKMQDGYPRGPLEVLVPDPLFGPIVLTDDFAIELKEDDQNFKPVALAYLITILEAHRD